MSKKLTIALAALLMFMAISAFADSGCKNGKFVGTYTLGQADSDVFGDRSAIHGNVFQLTFNSDGTANQYWTGLPDFEITLGTGSPWIGSWKCRNDGKLVATFIRASYIPSSNLNLVVPGTDIELSNHVRNTYLFTVTDENTLTRTQDRARVYAANLDPTDANGGVLGTLHNTSIAFKRLVATDADLLLP